jgi:hypothetical protein
MTGSIDSTECDVVFTSDGAWAPRDKPGSTKLEANNDRNRQDQDLLEGAPIIEVFGSSQSESLISPALSAAAAPAPNPPPGPPEIEVIEISD